MGRIHPYRLLRYADAAKVSNQWESKDDFVIAGICRHFACLS